MYSIKPNTRSLLLLSMVLLVAGCSTSQDSMLPQPDTSVKDVWQQRGGPH